LNHARIALLTSVFFKNRPLGCPSGLNTSINFSADLVLYFRRREVQGRLTGGSKQTQKPIGGGQQLPNITTMSSLIIISAKPNPLGKDRTSHGPIARQLLGEWVDIRNDGLAAISLADKGLAHLAYDQNGRVSGNPVIYWPGDRLITLLPGQTVRIHTGKRADALQADPADTTGATYHSYAEEPNFVLNNRYGDTITLWRKDAAGNWQAPFIDLASYAANPAEGQVLYRRQGSNLLV